MARNKYPEETVKKILDVSLRLFLEKGYEATTVLDIVEGLGGLTRGAFYHHFKSKEEVLDALEERRFEEHNPFDAVEARPELNGLEKLREVLYLSSGDERARALHGPVASLLNSPRFLAELLASNEQRLVPRFGALIREGMADGSIRPGDADAEAGLLALLLNFWLIPTVFPCSEQACINKVYLVREVLEGLGLPVLDDVLTEQALRRIGDLYRLKSGPAGEWREDRQIKEAGGKQDGLS